MLSSESGWSLRAEQRERYESLVRVHPRQRRLLLAVIGGWQIWRARQVELAEEIDEIPEREVHQPNVKERLQTLDSLRAEFDQRP
jgi:hypothetical protein